MPYTLTILLFGSVLSAAAGESRQPANGTTTAEAQVARLQEQFTQRLYEEMLPKLNELTLAKVQDQAGQAAERIWKETLGAQPALLQRRTEEILAALDKATPFDETKYEVVAEVKEVKELLAAKDAQRALPRLRMLLWSPLAAADFAASQLQARTLGVEDFGKRAMLASFAKPAWKAVDRSVERPKLQKRMGPEIVVVELKRQGDYYLPARVRWLRRDWNVKAEDR